MCTSTQLPNIWQYSNQKGKTTWCITNTTTVFPFFFSFSLFLETPKSASQFEFFLLHPWTSSSSLPPPKFVDSRKKVLSISLFSSLLLVPALLYNLFYYFSKLHSCTRWRTIAAVALLLNCQNCLPGLFFNCPGWSREGANCVCACNGNGLSQTDRQKERHFFAGQQNQKRNSRCQPPDKATCLCELVSVFLFLPFSLLPNRANIVATAAAAASAVWLLVTITQLTLYWQCCFAGWLTTTKHRQNRTREKWRRKCHHCCCCSLTTTSFDDVVLF